MFMDSTRIIVSLHALQRWRERIGAAGDGPEAMEASARRSVPVRKGVRSKRLWQIIGSLRRREAQKKGRIWFCDEQSRAYFLMAVDRAGEFTVVTCVSMDEETPWPEPRAMGKKAWRTRRVS